MSEHIELAIPLIVVTRVLVPGARTVVTIPAAHPAAGPEARQVMLALHVGDESPFTEVGTVAAVMDRRRRGDHVVLVLHGERRGRIVAATPGAAGTVVRIVAEPEVVDSTAHAALGSVTAALRRYQQALIEAGEPANIDVAIADEPTLASYQVASLARVSAPELQFLIEADTVAERLERERQLLERETELLRRMMKEHDGQSR